MLWILFIVLALFVTGVIVFVNQPRFGSTPKGARLERVRNSPNYRDGKFQNIEPTEQLTSDEGFITSLRHVLLKRNANGRPKDPIPSVKTDLWNLHRDEEVLIWFGHSSYLLQINGRRLLIDPVLSGSGSPVSFINKPFPGADTYRPADIPEIDYLVISHDHWDHLDYTTVREIKERVGKVICGLGVGQHFERWGFTSEQLIELDWNEEAVLGGGLTVYCLPARHFSGRSLNRNQSLWVSYLFDFPSCRVYIGGDSGYGKHFAGIGERFGNIDLAILENGQYSDTWKYMHTRPQYLVQAFNDLKAKRLFTVHHSKFSLSNRHSWSEPLEHITRAAEQDSIPLIQPMIGEKVNLRDSIYTLYPWWENIR